MEALETIIKAAAETVLNGTGSYTYARKAEFSLDHDKPAPHIVFFDPTGKEGNVVRSFNCLFMFSEPDPETETRGYRYELTARMGTLALKFFAELDKHDLILLGEKSTEKMVKEFQGRLSGVAYQVTITTALPLNCEPLTA